MTPAETVARVRPLLPVMGITRIANVSGLDSIGIPVVMVCRPNARSLSVSQGKGISLDAAKASGLMESIELYHAETITLPLKLATFAELRFTHPIVDIEALPQIGVRSFHDHLRLLWIEGWELLTGRTMWVPYELVHTNYALPLPSGSGAFVNSSNGLASGNHLLEAISHGICEVVERDATTLWHLGGDQARRRTRVDLATVDDPGCAAILDRYERAGVAVAVWETTTDVGIPSFLCTIADREQDPLRVLYPSSGMGCHPAREVALLRALTEAAQSRLTMVAGSRDDGGRRKYERSRNLDANRSALAEMTEEGPTRSFRDAPTREHDTLDEDLRWELQRLHAAGIMQVIAVDLTKPIFDIAVARVIIPGLESVHDAPGYVPGPRGRRILEGRAA
ncbi:YcaO-like family protein [Sorangium sp. So ce406]|uniref:YcaO-like family protein n=1 Tax=Sorangium sp. So ce406 TaxID=3133311 RepID=UPI003F5BBC09